MDVDRGWAGASARRQSLGLRGPDRARWERGAEGEAILGALLADVPEVLVLHDRAMPRRSANIDHIAVAPSGVYVIDAKHYSGEPRADVIDGVRRLFVGGDDATELVDGVRWQARAIEAVLGATGVPVQPILCFIGSSWSISNGLLIDGVGITSPDRLVTLLQTAGPLRGTAAAEVHRELGDALAPA